MSDHQRDRSDCWPHTRWSLIDRVRREGIEGARPFLTELLGIYSPAMRAYLASRTRLPAYDVEELLQGFIADRILEKHLISQADPSRGKFRCLLLTALRRYVYDQLRRNTAAKRHPKEGSVVPLEDHADPAADDDLSSEVFDEEWGRQVLDEALRRMREECERSDQSRTWGIWEARILRPLLEKAEPLPYKELVERFGFESPSQATNTLETAKRMFDRTLRSVVGEYEEDETDIEEEIRYLAAVLAKSAAR